jgi:hypothetical protein
MNVTWFFNTKHCFNTRRVPKVKIHHASADREFFNAYCGNTAVDLDPLPVSHARLTVVEPALFE